MNRILLKIASCIVLSFFTLTSCGSESNDIKEPGDGDNSGGGETSTVKAEDVFEEIVFCGEKKAYIINVANSNRNDLDVVWEYDASNKPAPISTHVAEFNDCKSVNDNKEILLTSAWGCLLIDRATQECLFYSDGIMGHSAELLPNRRIVTALSHALNGSDGDRIQLFEVGRNNELLWEHALSEAHGVVWIEARQRLYAIGATEIREYQLKDWETKQPSLEQVQTWMLPTEHGHDLSYISDNELGCTTNTNTYIFNIDTGTFDVYVPLQGKNGVKSFNYDKETGCALYTVQTEEWWTQTITFINPTKILDTTGYIERTYKVRPVRK